MMINHPKMWVWHFYPAWINHFLFQSGVDMTVASCNPMPRSWIRESCGNQESLSTGIATGFTSHSLDSWLLGITGLPGHLEDVWGCGVCGFFVGTQKNLGRVPRPTHPIFLHLDQWIGFGKIFTGNHGIGLPSKVPGKPWEPKSLRPIQRKLANFSRFLVRFSGDQLVGFAMLGGVGDLPFWSNISHANNFVLERTLIKHRC